MKKITIFAMAVLAISFASCEKERVCTCTTTTDEPGIPESTYKIEYKDVTKKQMKQACMSLKVKPDGQQYTETRTCKID